MAERLARRREEHVRRGKLYRVLFVLCGVVVTIAGVAMLALPGPAFVVIPIGLAMLAMEFTWAEKALEKALEQADKAQEKARQASPLQKRLSVAATVLAIAAAAVVALLYDIPLIPDP
jgi:uncharacterized protein (TIGR02611 family)